MKYESFVNQRRSSWKINILIHVSFKYFNIHLILSYTVNIMRVVPEQVQVCPLTTSVEVVRGQTDTFWPSYKDSYLQMVSVCKLSTPDINTSYPSLFLCTLAAGWFQVFVCNILKVQHLICASSWYLQTSWWINETASFSVHKGFTFVRFSCPS